MVPTASRNGIEIIGAGFGRTGTLSLKTALERLGFAPCYHMMEVFAQPAHAETWRRAADDAATDFEAVFAGYRATVDWPACAFWRELADAYPSAKVLLSVRPPDRWHASFRETIYEALQRPLAEEEGSPEAMVFGMARQVVIGRSFGGHLGDRDALVAAYDRHNAAVRAGIAPDR